MSGSYVHSNWLDTQKDLYPGAPRELQWLSETSWACRYMACKTILERLLAIIRDLEEVAAENSGDRSVDALRSWIPLKIAVWRPLPFQKEKQNEA